MKLTGKCKEDFEKWFNESGILSLDRMHIFNVSPLDRLKIFYKMGDSMQWGVYQDFFAEKDLVLDVYKADLLHKKGMWVAFVNEFDLSRRGFDLCAEARSESVNKANELYNLRQ